MGSSARTRWGRSSLRFPPRPRLGTSRLLDQPHELVTQPLQRHVVVALLWDQHDVDVAGHAMAFESERLAQQALQFVAPDGTAVALADRYANARCWQLARATWPDDHGQPLSGSAPAAAVHRSEVTLRAQAVARGLRRGWNHGAWINLAQQRFGCVGHLRACRWQLRRCQEATEIRFRQVPSLQLRV